MTFSIKPAPRGNKPSVNPTCPPCLVNTIAMLGHLESNSNGIDSSGANGSSAAFKHKSGILILHNGLVCSVAAA